MSEILRNEDGLKMVTTVNLVQEINLVLNNLNIRIFVWTEWISFDEQQFQQSKIFIWIESLIDIEFYRAKQKF